MRLHTNLTEGDIRAAGRLAGVGFERLTVHGSRKRDRAFDVILTGGSIHANHWTRSGEYRAATWDQWGVFLGALYRQDAAMVSAYQSADHFLWSTNGRYSGAFFVPCLLHKWQHEYDRYAAHGHQTCAKCGAVRRWLTDQKLFVEFEQNHLDDEWQDEMGTPYASGGDYERRYLAEISA